MNSSPGNEWKRFRGWISSTIRTLIQQKQFREKFLGENKDWMSLRLRRWATCIQRHSHGTGTIIFFVHISEWNITWINYKYFFTSLSQQSIQCRMKTCRSPCAILRDANDIFLKYLKIPKTGKAEGKHKNPSNWNRFSAYRNTGTPVRSESLHSWFSSSVVKDGTDQVSEIFQPEFCL